LNSSYCTDSASAINAIDQLLAKCIWNCWKYIIFNL
jgi:hypothetical protein